MITLRLFIGINAHPLIKEEISVLKNTLKQFNADVRWESPAKLHMTLRFLGSTNPALLPEIVSVLESVCTSCPPLRIRYSGTGCFPDRRRPRALWVGIKEDSGELVKLQKAITHGVGTLGFESDDKEFHPHVTLGRIRSFTNINRLLDKWESTTFESQPTVVTHVDVFKSELHSEGSSYTVLNSIPLRG